MIDFSRYISATNIVVADVFIPLGGITPIEEALAEVRKRIDTAGYSLSGVDVKAKLIDFRTGNIYQVFSASFMNEYPAVPHWYAIEYNKEYVDTLASRIVSLEQNTVFKSKIDLSIFLKKREMKAKFLNKETVVFLKKNLLHIKLKGIV